MEKKKSEKKHKKNKGLSEDEIEELKKKIEKKFKTLETKKEPDSELETALRRIESLEEEDFTELLASQRFDAPVLRQIAIAPQIANIGPGIASAPAPVGVREDDPFKYDIGPGSQEEDKKYISTSATMSARTEQINFNEIGRGPDRFLEERNFFVQSPEAKSSNNWGVERYDLPSRTDIEGAGRQDTLKKEERKYDPKLPR